MPAGEDFRHFYEENKPTYESSLAGNKQADIPKWIAASKLKPVYTPQPRGPNGYYKAANFENSVYFVKTGEYREPQAGEWYLSSYNGKPQAQYANRNLLNKYYILRKVSATEPHEQKQEAKAS